MKTKSVAAERTWLAIAPDGGMHKVVLRVGAPTGDADGPWLAPVSLLGLEKRTIPIAGADAWQATALAMYFVKSRVEQYTEQGWKFYWDDDSEPVTAEDL